VGQLWTGPHDPAADAMRKQQQYDNLPVAARRRLVVESLLRSTLTVTVLIVLYYLLPLDHMLNSGAAIWLIIGLMAFAVVITWQVRAIARSDTPRLRAVETLTVGLPMLLLIFSAVYVVLEHNQSGSFTEPLDRVGSAYFTLTVFATVGFGDIAPITELARLIVMLQMIVDLVAVGVIARVIIGAVEVSVHRRSGSSPDDDKS
jgi:hypothetical protein